MIESLTQTTLAELLPLMRAYQSFYDAQHIDDENNARFFAQFCKGSTSGCVFLYRQAAQVVGFATVYFSYSSTITSKVGVLNDVYVAPDCRGQGVGRALIEHARDFAKTSGCARLQWVTAPDNTPAQRLYDTLDVNKSSWYFYSYSWAVVVARGELHTLVKLATKYSGHNPCWALSLRVVVLCVMVSCVAGVI